MLSTRDDIIVLVDEAHRTQYKNLAENMRTALPNANFVAFTGTPLLGTKRLTNQWFGGYVSEYNFSHSLLKTELQCLSSILEESRKLDLRMISLTITLWILLKKKILTKMKPVS